MATRGACRSAGLSSRPSFRPTRRTLAVRRACLHATVRKRISCSAIRLPWATAPNRLVEIDVPPLLERGALVTITGTVLDGELVRDEDFRGSVDLLVQDQPVSKKAFGAPWDQVGTIYNMPGATIFSGKAAVNAGQFAVSFVVPVSLRGGPRVCVRRDAYSGEADAAGAVDSILVGGVATVATHTIPPEITVSLPNGNAAAGATVEAVVEDASGINLTQVFEFRSLQFAVLDEAGVERFRTDVTSQFSYDEGSHTKGEVSMSLPYFTLRGARAGCARGAASGPSRRSFRAGSRRTHRAPHPGARNRRLAVQLRHQHGDDLLRSERHHRRHRRIHQQAAVPEEPLADARGRKQHPERSRSRGPCRP